MTIPFRLSPSMIAAIMASPAWMAALLRHGRPRFASIERYVGPRPGISKVARFAQQEIGGAFTWEEVARYRKRWSGPLVVKGFLHLDDATRTIELGADGIWVSNHGGRQLEALPAAIDMLPAIAEATDGRATVLFDSGIRSGLDVARAIAAGASAAFAGKAFLWGIGALGIDGASHVTRLLREELTAVMRQVGAEPPSDLVHTVRQRARSISADPLDVDFGIP